ncbi:MAG: peptidylprolyl isomerase [Myxococcota bacterium]
MGVSRKQMGSPWSSRACWLALLVACGGAPPSAAEVAAPPIDAPPQESSDLIEVRTLVIAWAGAEGVGSDVTRSEAQARVRAETVADLARQPDSNFGELARAYADAPPATERLERGAEGIEPTIAGVAFNLNIGQIGGPVRTDAGFVVVERRPDPLTGPAEVEARHILIVYEGSRAADEETTRTQEEARLRAEEVVRRAREGEDWDALHARYSEEPNGPPGGSLGTFGRGQMTPAFERAVFGLEVGSISDAILTPFGYHVIQRTR